MPAPPRRRFRIGIGGMMLAILAFGLCLGDRVNRARRLREAVAAVKGDGGFVLYADEFRMGPVGVAPGSFLWKPSWGTLVPGQGPMAPAWLRRAVGDEYFREMAHVSLFVDIQKGSASAPNNLARPVDDVLGLLRGQPAIKTLHLGGETVTDKGLEALADQTDLRELIIWWATAISDAGVAHLGRLPRLRMIDISLSPLTDDAVRHLAGLPALEELTIQGSKFTDRSLTDLSQATRLKSLTLRGDRSEFGDEGLGHLAGLKDLRRLHLQKGKFSEAAKARLLKAIPKLEIIP